MATSRQPGDLFKAFQAKKHKAAPALTASHNPGSMPGFAKPVTRSANPNAPENYGPAMRRAYAATKVFGMPQKRKRKASSAVIPTNYGKKNQEANAKKFGIVPQSSTRTMSKKKRKGSNKRRKIATPGQVSQGVGQLRTQQAISAAQRIGSSMGATSNSPVTFKKRKVSKLNTEMAFKKKRKSAPLQDSALLRGVKPGAQRVQPIAPWRPISGTRFAKRKSAKKKAMMGCA